MISEFFGMKKLHVLFWVGAAVLGGCALYGVAKFVITSGIAEGQDRMFGDQHLKTTVALVELHKVRFGRYPASLEGIKFSGQWDQIALQSVDYWTDKDGKGYYLEVRRGFIAKPKLEMPAEFWKGTGYSPALKPVGSK
jgi:hypothetical protein